MLQIHEHSTLLMLIQRVFTWSIENARMEEQVLLVERVLFGTIFSATTCVSVVGSKHYISDVILVSK
jgi:hypothetical protein